jgi:hypothetical protein
MSFESSKGKPERRLSQASDVSKTSLPERRPSKASDISIGSGGGGGGGNSASSSSKGRRGSHGNASSDRSSRNSKAGSEVSENTWLSSLQRDVLMEADSVRERVLVVQDRLSELNKFADDDRV